MSAGIFAGWPLIAGLGGPATLGTLTISPATAMIGQAYTGTISGATPGSTITLDSLAVTGSGTTRTVTGTPSGSPGNWAGLESSPNATNSPKTTLNLLTVTPFVAPLTALRATNAGFAPVPELGPSTGTSQTTRSPTAPFNEPFERFDVVYQVFRVRTVSVVGTIDNGAGAAGDILTVTTVTSGAVVPGITITNAGPTITAGTYVLSQLSGDMGGIGTYKLSTVQSAAIASGTVTSTQFVDELHQNGGAIQTYDAGFGDTVFQGRSGVPTRTRITFDGGNTTKVYNYATWDKTQGLFASDIMLRPRRTGDALDLWQRVRLPSNLAGLPVNKLANAFTFERWWGNELVTSGDSVDPVTGASIAGVATTQAGATPCIVPIAIRIYTAGAVPTVIALTDSRGAQTGLGITGEPAGFGDSQGDLVGRGSGMERGLHRVGTLHSLMLAKPTDRAFYLAKAPGAWRFRRQAMQICGENVAGAKYAMPALGQNDGDAPVNWAANMDLPLGLPITTSTRVYVVVAAGVSGATAPTSTTLGADIALGTATVRYYGTDATANNRLGLALGGKNHLINQAIRAACPGIGIAQEGLGPFTSSTDNWLTAAGQSDGFLSAGGKTYQAQLAALGGSFTGADRVVSSMSLLAGSRTVDGGPDDGTRTWGTPAPQVALNLTPDGIHNGNRGAEVAAPAYTKLAVTGTA